MNGNNGRRKEVDVTVRSDVMTLVCVYIVHIVFYCVLWMETCVVLVYFGLYVFWVYVCGVYVRFFLGFVKGLVFLTSLLVS